MTEPGVIRRGLLTCLVVGTLINLINHGQAVADGEWEAIRIWRVGLTYVIPFAVSVFASVGTKRREQARSRQVEALLEHQALTAKRFPDENPHPVMRVTEAGELTYANPASQPITAALGVKQGDRLPADVLSRLREAEASSAWSVEVESDHRTFAIYPVAVPELGFINLYGTDVTANKVVAKFPDQNPNPVLRANTQGQLIYGNPASALLRATLGLELGAPLPSQLAEQVAGNPSPVELLAGWRTYSVQAVPIPEFDFINLYATDITAQKAITKFPDQNPNPVWRVNREGTLLYANAASTPLLQAFGIEVGGPVPASLQQDILARVDAGSSETIEVNAGDLTFSLLGVMVPEFGFINIYGTDITAAKQIAKAHAENERLLLSILPASIAKRLREGETVIADRFEDVTLLFADIVGFTQLSARMEPSQVVDLLNQLFRLFDELADRHGLEKVKTIGDSYMVVGGLPNRTPDHPARVADMAIDLRDELTRSKVTAEHGIRFRIGMHTGPAVAGVIGTKKFIYDVWGDTVNTASRMEALGVPGVIHVTEEVFDRLRDSYRFEPRGVIDVKGKGPMKTYFLTGKGSSLSAERGPSRDGL